MIAHLSGTVLRPGVIDVAGVGYDVRYLGAYVTGTEVSLYITSIWGHDSSLILYGFENTEEQAIFSAICKVPGVGASVALALLRAHGTRGFIEKVSAKDIEGIATAPGVGRKTAEKIITLVVGLPEQAQGEVPATDPLVSALVSLGFDLTKSESSVRGARQDGSNDEAELLRRALSLVRDA
jgi:Holliday junction DNA helicase RuvA